jgi:hypothetical protein
MPAGCVENGYSYNTNNVAETIVYNSNQCKEKCSAQQDCQFWTWSNNQCHLKNENALEKRVLKDAISGSGNCPGKCHHNDLTLCLICFVTKICRILQFYKNYKSNQLI